MQWRYRLFAKATSAPCPPDAHQDPAATTWCRCWICTQQPGDLRPEVHRKNVDVQFLVSGTELIGVAADRGDNLIHQELLAQRDIIFYQEVADSPS